MPRHRESYEIMKRPKGLLRREPCGYPSAIFVAFRLKQSAGSLDIGSDGRTLSYGDEAGIMHLHTET